MIDAQALYYNTTLFLAVVAVNVCGAALIAVSRSMDEEAHWQSTKGSSASEMIHLWSETSVETLGYVCERSLRNAMRTRELANGISWPEAVKRIEDAVTEARQSASSTPNSRGDIMVQAMIDAIAAVTTPQVHYPKEFVHRLASWIV